METTDLIIVTSAVVAGSTLLKDVKEGHPSAGPVIFGFLLAGALLLIAIPGEKFARGLSYFALIGALAVNGAAVFGIAGGLSKSTAPATPAAPVQSAYTQSGVGHATSGGTQYSA